MKKTMQNGLSPKKRAQFNQYFQILEKKQDYYLQQTSQKSQTKIAKKWDKEQLKFFLEYFIDEIIRNPCIIYSLDSPLKRNDTFRHVSQHIANRLGPKRAMNHYQCKSKYQTIRRWINRQKEAQKKAPQYSFLDYIFEQCHKNNFVQDFEQKIKQLSRMNEQQSNYMRITKKLIEMAQNDKQIEEKNSLIIAYLKKKKKYEENQS